MRDPRADADSQVAERVLFKKSQRHLLFPPIVRPQTKKAKRKTLGLERTPIPQPSLGAGTYFAAGAGAGWPEHAPLPEHDAFALPAGIAEPAGAAELVVSVAPAGAAAGLSAHAARAPAIIPRAAVAANDFPMFMLFISVLRFVNLE